MQLRRSGNGALKARLQICRTNTNNRNIPKQSGILPLEMKRVDVAVALYILS